MCRPFVPSHVTQSGPEPPLSAAVASSVHAELLHEQWRPCPKKKRKNTTSRQRHRSQSFGTHCLATSAWTWCNVLFQRRLLFNQARLLWPWFASPLNDWNRTKAAERYEQLLRALTSKNLKATFITIQPQVPLSPLHLETETRMKGGHFSALFPQYKITNRGLRGPALHVNLGSGGSHGSSAKIKRAAINTSWGEGQRAAFLVEKGAGGHEALGRRRVPRLCCAAYVHIYKLLGFAQVLWLFL